MEIGSSGKRSVSATEGSATDFEVKLRLKPGIERLKPGMTADAEIQTATHTDALMVPIQSIVVREKKTVDKWMAERDEEKKDRKKGKGKKDDEEPSSEQESEVESLAVTSDSSEAAGEDAGERDEESKEEAKEEEEITGIFIVEEEHAKFVRVKTGIMSETDIEILEGLSRDDRVITGPFRVLRDLKDGKRIEEEKEKKGKKEGREEEEG
jgi:HlyD family secretion protein